MSSQLDSCCPSITVNISGFVLNAERSSMHFLHFSSSWVMFVHEVLQQLISLHEVSNVHWADERTFLELISEPPHASISPVLNVLITWACHGIECGLTPFSLAVFGWKTFWSEIDFPQPIIPSSKWTIFSEWTVYNGSLIKISFRISIYFSYVFDNAFHEIL